MTDAVAAIIAAVIGAVGAVLAARFNDIVDLFRTPSRQIAGEWEGESYLLHRGPVDDSEYEQKRPPDLNYVLTLKQTGSRIKGTMTMTEAQPGIGLYKHTYKGRVKGDYFIYECSGAEPETFSLSAALLHVHNSGKVMRGYFIANAGYKDSSHTPVGYTVAHKRD